MATKCSRTGNLPGVNSTEREDIKIRSAEPADPTVVALVPPMPILVQILPIQVPNNGKVTILGPRKNSDLQKNMHVTD